MKQDYTIYITKADSRTKSGYRAVSTTVWTARDDAGMHREVIELYNFYPMEKGYKIEYAPSMKMVKSLMTGELVAIDRDTPWSCNPASESYWSN